MPSDLNLKKSWNPQLLKNREKVWQKEREVLEQYKKTQNYNSKLKDINEKNELLSLVHKKDDESKEYKVNKSTNWMYQSTTTQEDYDKLINEDVLLGKRRLNEVINNGKPAKKMSRIDKFLKYGLEKESEDANYDQKNETGAASILKRDQLSKSDPLYAVKLQQLKHQEMIEKQNKVNKYMKESTKMASRYGGEENAYRNRERDSDYKKSHKANRGHQNSHTYEYVHNNHGSFRNNRDDRNGRSSRKSRESKHGEIYYDRKNSRYDRSRDYDPERKQHNYRDRF